MSRKILRKKIIWLISLFLLVLVFTLHYPQKIVFRGMAPDFILLAALSTSFFIGLHEGIIMGFTAGLIKDIFMSPYPGSGALLYMYLAILAFYLFKRIVLGEKTTFFLKVILLSLLNGLIFALAVLVFNPSQIMSKVDFIVWWSAEKLLPVLILNLVFSLPFYLIFRLIVRSLNKDEHDLYVKPMKII